MFNLLSFAMYRSMSFELKYSVNSVPLKLMLAPFNSYLLLAVLNYIYIYIIFLYNPPPPVFLVLKNILQGWQISNLYNNKKCYVDA